MHKKKYDIITGRKVVILIFAKLVDKIIQDAKADGIEVNQTILAEKGMNTVRSNFSNKKVRDSFSLDDVVGISNYLGMRVFIEGRGRKYEIKRED